MMLKNIYQPDMHLEAHKFHVLLSKPTFIFEEKIQQNKQDLNC